MRLNLRRLHRGPVVIPPIPFEVRPEDPPGAVHFQTEIAKQRFIRLEPMGDAVHFVAPRTRLWPGQPERTSEQLVTRGGLPDTVTCGRGYIEVVAFVDDGSWSTRCGPTATR